MDDATLSAIREKWEGGGLLPDLATRRAREGHSWQDIRALLDEVDRLRAELSESRDGAGIAVAMAVTAYGELRENDGG